MSLTPPREPVANVLYRQEVRKWALQSKANRKYLRDRCSEDWFFFAETFLWLFEPRPEKGRSNIIPFIPWDHQRPEIQKILDGLGYEDFGIEKSRGEGATWSCLMIILHRWLFREMHAYGLVSRHEAAVDNPEDPDSLGWKIDWQIAKLPRWLVGQKDKHWTRNISKHTWVRKDNGSTITGYPCTGDLASGGRKTAFFMDEFAKFDRGPDEDALSAVEPVTNSLLLVSTYDGADGAYHRVMHDETSTMKKLILSWEDNPTRNQNLFTLDIKHKRLRPVGSPKGTYWEDPYVEEFFKEHLPKLQRRGFDVHSTTKKWSPWYVSRCLRAGMTPKKIAQEYDRDAGGTGSRFFPHATIEMLAERAERPYLTGDIEWDSEQLRVSRFTQMATGHLKLWLKLLGGNVRPPVGNYVIGADIASGQGGDMSSNSTLSILNRDTGKKVGEYANPAISPEQFAELAISLCWWFKNEDGQPAYLIWEGNGYGGLFRDRIMETSFRNFHWRISGDGKNQKKKRTREPGWWSNKDAKKNLLGKYRWCLIEGHFENHSVPALKETLYYQNTNGGKVEFVGSMKEEEDPAHTGENHGDRVIADALANLGMEELNGGIGVASKPAEEKRKMAEPPQGSFRYRQKMRQEAKRKKDYW